MDPGSIHPWGVTVAVGLVVAAAWAVMWGRRWRRRCHAFERELEAVSEVTALATVYEDWSIRVPASTRRRFEALVESINELLAFNEAHERAVAAGERALDQAQRVDALGRLAGGVAHDFNNLLTVIRCTGEALLEDLPEDFELIEEVEELITSADRGAALTGQLLAFSRRQDAPLEKLYLRDVVRDATRMLQRLVGDGVTLELNLHDAEARDSLQADRRQLEQILMNLVVNARDAMPAGGQITISTRVFDIDGRYAGDVLGVSAGRWLELAVRDQGVGMSDEVLAQAFEPFFTTKAAGKGTGLGLATVRGIVERSGGRVVVDSAVGQGTCITALFPAEAAGISVAEAPVPVTAPDLRGHEGVLVVEDQVEVRRVVVRAFASAGYDVYEASNGREGLALFLANRGAIALLVSDVLMPEMTGPDLATALRGEHPALPILFMSGYTEGLDLSSGSLDGGTRFVQKPFATGDLLAKARELLDAGRISPATRLLRDLGGGAPLQ